jgi:hypothetical protein
MAFDVSRFLALTVLIAATGAACSGTDDKDNETNDGGEAGSSTSGKAGQGNDSAGGDAGGAGGAAANGGAGGDKTAAGAGGESLGGAGGAGGAEVGECLGSLAEGGAGGEPGVEPSLEDLCGAFFDTCPGAENLPASYSACEGVRHHVTPGVAVAFADCITALSTDDQCDEVKVTECFTDLRGRGCSNPGGATACVSITGNCELVTEAECLQVLDLVGEDMTDAVKGCMDPADEGWYNENFGGSCAERLDYCAGLEF